MDPEDRPEDIDLWVLTSKPGGPEAQEKPEGSTEGQNDRDRRVDMRFRESLQEVYHLTSKWLRKRTENGKEEIFKAAIYENFSEFMTISLQIEKTKQVPSIT